MKTIGALIAVFVTMPIWYFIMYTVLSAIHADRLVWFLFWVYVPFTMFVAVMEKIALHKKD